MGTWGESKVKKAAPGQVQNHCLPSSTWGEGALCLGMLAGARAYVQYHMDTFPSAFPSAPCGARCFSISGFRELDPLYSRWELRTYRVKRSVGLRDVLMTLEHAA